MVRPSHPLPPSHLFLSLTSAVLRAYRPQLLRVPQSKVEQKEAEGEEEEDKELEPHADERQIKLDTDRSFVLYPVGDSSLLLPLSFRCTHNMTCISTVHHVRARSRTSFG